MQRKITATLVAALALTAVACSSSTDNDNRVNAFVNTKLVADVAGFGAAALDPDLVNPWGVAFSATGTLWVADNGTSSSTLYDATGTKLATVITIPSSTSATDGAPTGIVLNTTLQFNVAQTGPALFFFAGEDGTISAWNPNMTEQAVVVVDRSAQDAVYKGIAIGSSGGANFLFATDFMNNRVDVFNTSFELVSSFTDPDVPAGYGPFGIANIAGQLYITFAKQDPDNPEDDKAGAGLGYVDIYTADGTKVGRFASQGELNAPWAVVKAPSAFGDFSNTILVGNFGDGRILAYDAAGNFIAALKNTEGNAITLDGLWGLTFGVGANSNTLFYASGPEDEAHGLMGTITVQ